MIRPAILVNCLVKKDNKYLLVQEATDKVYAKVNTGAKSKWTLPHGLLNRGEQILTAAKRELLEETGGETRIRRLGVIAFCILDQTVCLLSFIFYGQGFRKSQKRKTNEIRKIGWFAREEIQRLEAANKIRDRVPISKIIKAVEGSCEVGFIKWEQPDYIIELFKQLKLNKDFSIN